MQSHCHEYSTFFVTESNPRLCAVLRTSSSIDRNMKDYWAFYAISTMASLVSQKMASLVSQKLVEAGKKFEYIVYVSLLR